MGRLTSSILKAEKISSECGKYDLICQFKKYFGSLFDDVVVPKSSSCKFTGILKNPNDEPYIRGKCTEGVLQKECISFSQSALNSMCYTQCQKNNLPLKRSVCYRNDIICECVKKV